MAAPTIVPWIPGKTRFRLPGSLLIKVQDGCAVNGHYWVYWVSTSHERYRAHPQPEAEFQKDRR